jgi:hypothetical protein
MKKKVLISAIAMLTLFSTLVGSTAFADTVSNSTLNLAPIEAKEMAQETGQNIVYHETGCYMVGKTIFIDISTYKCDGTTYNLDEIYSDKNNTFTKTSSGGLMVPNASTPPSDSTVWDWSKGAYTGSFTLMNSVYTNYRFTGYSSYNVKVTVSDDGYTLTKGAFTVTAIQDNNGLGASWSGKAGTYTATIVFSGCKPAENLAFEVSKPNDGGTDTGSITVSHP